MRRKWVLKSLSTTLLLAVVSGMALVSGQVPAKSGTIAGAVVDAQGKPLAGVVVTYLRAPDLAAPPAALVSGGAESDSHGAFSFNKLPAGTYLLCAASLSPALSLLDICEWTMTPPSVVLAVGQMVTGVTLPMTVGLNLQVRVNDPNGLLANGLAHKQGAFLIAGVWDAHGLFHMARLRSFDAGGQNLALTAPFGQTYRLDVSASGVVVQSPNGTNFPIQVAQGVSSQPYQFSVSVAP